jgi:hypothetical protein
MLGSTFQEDAMETDWQEVGIFIAFVQLQSSIHIIS